MDSFHVKPSIVQTSYKLILCLTLFCRCTLAPLERSSCTMSVWPLSLASMRAVQPFCGTNHETNGNEIGNRQLKKVCTCCNLSKAVASVPGFPSMQIKKGDSVVKVITWETSRVEKCMGERMNSPMLWQKIPVQLRKLYSWQNETRLQYAILPGSMVSVHRPVHLKTTLTCSLTWQTDDCTPWRMAFEMLMNAKAVLS